MFHKYIFCEYVNIFLKMHAYVFNILRNDLHLMSTFLWINIQFTWEIHCCDIWIFTEILLVIYKIFKNIYIICILKHYIYMYTWMFCLHVHLSTHTQKAIWYNEATTTKGCEPPCGRWKLNTEPLKEQLVLLNHSAFLPPWF